MLLFHALDLHLHVHDFVVFGKFITQNGFIHRFIEISRWLGRLLFICRTAIRLQGRLRPRYKVAGRQIEWNLLGWASLLRDELLGVKL